MRLIRIVEEKPLDGHRVQLILTDGRVIERDPERYGEIPGDARGSRHPCLAQRPGPLLGCSDLGRPAAGRYGFGRSLSLGR